MSKNLLRIALTGPESTGKTTLAKQLAAHYQTLFVPEFARYYLQQITQPYQAEDLKHICKGQQVFEQALSRQAKEVLLVDTEMLVIKIWHQHAYKFTPKYLEDALKKQHYDLYLLMDIDLPWQADPQREHPHLREYLFGIYQQSLEEMNVNFKIISGTGKERFRQATQYIEGLKAPC